MVYETIYYIARQENISLNHIDRMIRQHWTIFDGINRLHFSIEYRSNY